MVNNQFVLPKEKTKASRKNPRTVVLFSQKKTGKTDALTKLDDNLILDFDGSCEFYDAMAMPMSTLEDLDKTLIALKEQNAHYKYITIDTVTALKEKILNQIAVRRYNKEEDKSLELDYDITKLAYGLGYTYKKEALFKLFEYLQQFCDTLIITGHVADKSVTTTGQTIKELNLEGKLKDILALHVDAIGYIYRHPDKENINMLSFTHSEEVIGGTRSKHLRNKEFVISELKEGEEEITTHWDKIFI